MTNTMPAREVIDREFLEVRAALLRVAASLDRIDRGKDPLQNDDRLALLHAGIELLQSTDPDRAEKIQMLFSLPFDDAWASKFGLDLNRA